jgi:hypothetical protein
MINPKLTKQVDKQTSEEKLFKLLESIDWKLWEMYNMMKEVTGKDAKKTTTAKKSAEE